MSEALHSPIPFTQLLDDALKLSRRNLRPILVPISIPVAISAGLLPLAQGLLYKSMPMSPGAGPNLAALMTSGAAFFGAFLVFMAVQYVANGATFVAACDVVAGRPLSMRRAWLFPFRPATFATVLLTALAGLVGLMLCCLPAIYVGVVLSLTMPVMVLESVFGVDALRRSLSLASYNPTRTLTADPRVKIFVVLVVSMLVGMALSFVVQFPMMIVQQVFMLHSMSSGEGRKPAELMVKLAWLQVPTQMLSAVIQLLTRLYAAFGLALLYFDCKNRREGTDLERAIDELSAGTAG
jgi:hypothetical protein